MATIFRPNRPLGFDPKQGRAFAPNAQSISTVQAPQRGPAPREAPQQGRRAVNLHEWMGLNQEQGDQAAARIGDRLESTAKGAAQAQNQTRDEFTAGVQSGSVSFDPNVRDSAVAKAASTKSYTGPKDLTQTGSYQQAQQQTATAAQQLGLSNQDLARQEFGSKGGYGAGEQSYDAALLRGGDQRMGQLREKYSGLNEWLGRAELDARDIASKAEADTAAAATQYAQAAPRLEQEEIETERKATAAAGDQWMRDNGVTAAVQRAWIEAGRPALGPWLQQNSPELYKKYNSQPTGKTGSTQGLKSTPTKPKAAPVEMS